MTCNFARNGNGQNEYLFFLQEKFWTFEEGKIKYPSRPQTKQKRLGVLKVRKLQNNRNFVSSFCGHEKLIENKSSRYFYKLWLRST